MRAEGPPLSRVTQCLLTVSIERERGTQSKCYCYCAGRLCVVINYPIILFTDYKTKETKLVSPLQHVVPATVSAMDEC